MVLRIFKMIATSRFLTVSECIKFVFGRGFAPHALGKLTALPRPSSWFNGAPLLRERGRERRRGEEKNGRDRPPFRKFLDPPL